MPPILLLPHFCQIPRATLACLTPRAPPPRPSFPSAPKRTASTRFTERSGIAHDFFLVPILSPKASKIRTNFRKSRSGWYPPFHDFRPPATTRRNDRVVEIISRMMHHRRVAIADKDIGPRPLL